MPSHPPAKSGFNRGGTRHAHFARGNDLSRASNQWRRFVPFWNYPPEKFLARSHSVYKTAQTLVNRAPNFALMSTLATRTPTSMPDPSAPRGLRLDAELHFCRSALACGHTLAAQGQLESASRDVWLIEDAAVGIQRALAKVEDAEKLERYQRQLTQVLRELTELKEYLCIPPGFN